jgi:isopentenyl-diphosphate Delta-isomerase
MEQKVILVDEQDKQIGLEYKMDAHRNGGRLHRAISVYILNSEGKIMLQRRAEGKYHSGFLWSNACCTNCYEGETVTESAHRSLKNEMGFDCDIEEVFATIYKADVGNGLTEHEYLHIFFGIYDQNPKLNPDEASDWKWVSLNELVSDIKENGANYSSWLKLLLEGRLYEELKKFEKSSGV